MRALTYLSQQLLVSGSMATPVNGAEPQVDELSDDDFAYEEVVVESDDDASDVHNDLELALRTVKQLTVKQPAGADGFDQSERGLPAPGEASRRPEVGPGFAIDN